GGSRDLCLTPIHDRRGRGLKVWGAEKVIVCVPRSQNEVHVIVIYIGSRKRYFGHKARVGIVCSHSSHIVSTIVHKLQIAERRTAGTKLDFVYARRGAW